MSGPDHIHRVGDGRGPRDVFLNGIPVRNVLYANTMEGVVRCHDDPPKPDKHRNRLIERTRRGLVEIVFRDDDQA